jgi:bifunctional DNase/RNase
VANEATDIEKAKCAKHVKQEKTLAIWIGQLNTKKYYKNLRGF